MSVREKEMAELLAKTHREERLSAVTAYINPDVSAILDLGCGIGALTTRLAERFPSALIIGVDRSKYLISRLQKKENVLTILGDIPAVPFKNRSFDLVVAVQVLHEIFHFKGVHALTRTFQRIFDLLKKDGELIILDHFNPGDVSISFKLSEELRKKLREFQSKFKPRKINYHDLGKGWVRSSMRDFYDFITKIWALNSGLEEEEMSETHTPFTRQELVDFVQEAGFKVVHVTSITAIDRNLEHYGVTVEWTLNLPDRHIMLIAKKS
ncbi:MAG: methyltransferase domain-containing protein [Candidatus Bathyarchaeota archaeon]|nr:methyltransferase domain-containing protein [Candidatus Bathyarchaeota archaeon]MDH5494325.1 methyltransferase domain-containing protein [Candidatus Bathyarchaeota archaeon]